MTTRTQLTPAQGPAPDASNVTGDDAVPDPEQVLPDAAGTPVPPIVAPRWSRAWLVHRFFELLRFGSVGGLAFVVDFGLFNLLRFGPGEFLLDQPYTAKTISVAVATLVSWLGNRYWTFSERRTENRIRELLGFAIVNVGGLGVMLGCLWFSRNVLELTSPLADNISGNFVGLLLGMVFRYFAYRHLVFTKRS